MRVEAEGEMERYEEEVGLLGVECAVWRAQQLLVQHHIDAIPMVTRPVAPAEGAHPAREARRHVVHVDPWPKACGRRCRPERRSAPERAVGSVDAGLHLQKLETHVPRPEQSLRHLCK